MFPLFPFIPLHHPFSFTVQTQYKFIFCCSFDLLYSVVYPFLIFPKFIFPILLIFAVHLSPSSFIVHHLTAKFLSQIIFLSVLQSGFITKTVQSAACLFPYFISSPCPPPFHLSLCPSFLVQHDHGALFFQFSD